LPAGEPIRGRSGIDGGNERDDPIEIGTIGPKAGKIDPTALVDVAAQHLRPKRFPIAIGHCRRRMIRSRHGGGRR